jgi:hypothetical protein
MGNREWEMGIGEWGSDLSMGSTLALKTCIVCAQSIETGEAEPAQQLL